MLQESSSGGSEDGSFPVSNTFDGERDSANGTPNITDRQGAASETLGALQDSAWQSSVAPFVVEPIGAPATAPTLSTDSPGNSGCQSPTIGRIAAASWGRGIITAATVESFVSAPVDLASMANPLAGISHASVTNAAIGSDGATGAQVQQAVDESGLSVTSAGIRVGVLSDSFNDLGGAAEADGALPPASDIEILEDLPSGGTDQAGR